jgi:hypothetical protein
VDDKKRSFSESRNYIAIRSSKNCLGPCGYGGLVALESRI